MYKKSKFTVFFSNSLEEGSYFLYNTFSHGEVVVDKNVIDLLSYENIVESAENKELLGQLNEMGFIVLANEDEDDAFKTLFSHIQSSTDLMNFLIFTNMQCNLACSYCFEEGLMSQDKMSEAVSEQLILFLNKKIKEGAPEKVLITFYGGEPLINRPLIERVALELNTLSETAQFNLSYKIITNGTLLTHDVVDWLKNLGVDTLKITLDGGRSTHDSTRPFKNGKGSFDIIFNNLEYAVKHLNIILNCNMTKENIQGIFDLFDLLDTVKWSRLIKQVDVKPVMSTYSDSLKCSPEGNELPYNYDEENIDSFYKIHTMLKERGYLTDEGSAGLFCPVINKSGNFIVAVNGDIYECPSTVGIDKFKVGSVFDLDKKETIYTEEMWLRCKECVYAPICGGGCMYQALVRLGDYQKVDCPKNILEKELEEYLKKSYLKNKKT